MKTILIGLCLTITLCLQAQLPTNGLIGQWNFSGNANDASASNNNGTVNGAVLTKDRCGIPNSAYRFDGINDNIVMLNAGPTGTLSRSLSFWAKTSNTVSGFPRSSFDYGTANGNGDSYQVVWNYCSQGVGLDLSNQALIRSNSCLENNAWHHIAIVYDATVSTIYASVLFYIDGILQSNVTCNVSGLSALINTGATFPITIGSGATSFVRYWQGDLDDFYLYNRALSAAEVLQLYNLTPCAPPVYGSPIPCGSTAVYSIEPISGVTYTWTLSNGFTGTSSTNSINVGANGGATGSITVTYSSAACGFSGTATTTLSLGYSPIVTTFTIVTNSPLCAGSTLSLMTSVPSNSYSWSGPNNFASTVQNPTIANVGLPFSGIYSLTLFDAGCATATAAVMVNARPTLTVTNVTGSPSLTCISPSVDLLASSTYTGNLNYYWSSSSFTSANQGITITNPSTLISVVITDPTTGCSRSGTIAIGLNQTPPVSVVNPVNQNINCGPGVVATATGTAISPTLNVTHSWYSPGINVPTQGGGAYSIFGGMTPPNTYTYVLTDNVNGCSTTKTLQVTSSLDYPTFDVVSLAPYNFTVGCASTSFAVVNIINQNTIPTGGSMSFAVLPPGFSQPTYTYSNIFNYTLTTPGNYTFIVRDNNNGCEGRIIAPIIQDIFLPNASADVIPTRTLTCRTLSAILQGMSTTTNVSYSWSFQNGANPNTVPNATTTVQTTTNTAFSATVVNVYTLTVLNNNNQCKTTTLIPIYQNIRPPKPKINGAGPLDCNIFEQTLVNGSSKDEAPGYFDPLGTAVIKWDGPSPQVPNEDTVASYRARTVGIYTMTVMDRNNGCITQTTVLVADNKVYPVLQTNTSVALDCGATGVNLAAIAVGLKPGDVSALWTTPFPTPDIKNPNTLTLTTNGVGEYTLSVTTTSNGCKRDIHVSVTNGSLTGDFTPDVNTGFAPLTVNFSNNSASTSSVTGTSSVTSVWSFGNGSTRTTTTNVITSAVYNQPGTYTVTMFASKGACQDTVVKVIRVDIPSKLEVPNIFTPNGDNSNDIFFVKAANLSEITALIYDRWGNKVYELTTDKGNIAWDGKNLIGKDAPDGVYLYIITAKGKDGQNYDVKGTVTLLR